MKCLTMCCVAVALVGLAVCDVRAEDSTSVEYWRVRTRAKLAIDRTLRNGGAVVLKAKTSKPWMIFYTAPGCVPCVPVDQDAAAGLFPFTLHKWDITERTPPIDVPSVPAFHWNDAKGKGRQWPPPGLPDDKRGYPGAKALIQIWQASNPKVSYATRRQTIWSGWFTPSTVARQGAFHSEKPGRSVWKAMGRRGPCVLISA